MFPRSAAGRVTVSAVAGGVAHTSYEFGSILKFAEATFGLAPLATSDSRANPFGSDTFDFNAPPRPLAPIFERRSQPP